MTGVSNINQSADVLPFIGLTFTTDHYSQKLQPEVTVQFAFDTVYGEEEYGNASEVIPYRMPVNRNIFFTEELYYIIKLYPFIYPRI